jgi:ectoine hydroxylase-related dioxygenase (phytanoyl-CoA dioxygenase family)
MAKFSNGMNQETEMGAASNGSLGETRSAYLKDGFAVIRGFYDVQRDIDPIREGIRDIIDRLAKKYRVEADSSDPIAAMTKGYQSLINSNRGFGSEVYDAIKQIPAFVQLVSSPRNIELYQQIGLGAVPGIAAGGYGIRIDNPREEKFRAQWHQEFPAQLRSSDGMVFWSPLLDILPDMGPVQVLPGSQQEGLLDVHSNAAGAGKAGAYALHLDRENEILSRYTAEAPLLRAGDLLIMHFMTVHQSGFNVSDRPRWSMQFRYFNFADPVGLSISWQGSFAAGVDFKEVLTQTDKTAKKVQMQ